MTQPSTLNSFPLAEAFQTPSASIHLQQLTQLPHYYEHNFRGPYQLYPTLKNKSDRNSFGEKFISWCNWESRGGSKAWVNSGTPVSISAFSPLSWLYFWLSIDILPGASLHVGKGGRWPPRVYVLRTNIPKGRKDPCLYCSCTRQHGSCGQPCLQATCSSLYHELRTWVLPWSDCPARLTGPLTQGD